MGGRGSASPKVPYCEGAGEGTRGASHALHRRKQRKNVCSWPFPFFILTSWDIPGSFTYPALNRNFESMKVYEVEWRLFVTSFKLSRGALVYVFVRFLGGLQTPELQSNRVWQYN